MPDFITIRLTVSDIQNEVILWIRVDPYYLKSGFSDNVSCISPGAPA